MVSALFFVKRRLALKGKIHDLLAKLGISGENAKNELANFLNNLMFQLANGDIKGFDEIRQKMLSEFGISLETIEGLDGLLGGSFQSLKRKQQMSNMQLKMLQNELDMVSKTVDTMITSVSDGLDAEGQLKMMSDKDLNGKVVDLKKTLAILDRGNVGESSTCRQRRRDSQRARFPIHSPDLGTRVCRFT